MLTKEQQAKIDYMEGFWSGEIMLTKEQQDIAKIDYMEGFWFGTVWGGSIGLAIGLVIGFIVIGLEA